MNVTKRVIEWNSVRYEQEYDEYLTNSLLKEEVEELLQANTGDEDDLVHQVDALCDIIYVATGAMWKLGLTAKQIKKCLHAVCDANDTKVVVHTESHVKANLDKGDEFIPPEQAIKGILCK